MQVLGDIQVLQDTLEKVKKMSVFFAFFGLWNSDFDALESQK